MSLAIKATKVFEKLCAAWDFFRVLALQGGTRSSKTYSILQKLCLLCIESPEGLVIIIGAKTLTWSMKNIFPDFKEILGEKGLKCWDNKHWNGGRYTYKLGNSTIYFVGFEGAKGEEKAHGLSCDICFLNEANFISHSLYRQLSQRCRLKMILDFNPGFGGNHWIAKSVLPHPNCYFMKSTFRDNPFLSKEQIETILGYEPTERNIILGTADLTYWKIYGLGEMAAIEGLIYPNWSELSDKEWVPIREYEKFRYGMDFGFSDDPTTIVDVGLLEGTLYLRERLHERGLTSTINPHNLDQNNMEQRMADLKINKQTCIWADSARPEIIMDLKNCGYNIVGAPKGAGSVLVGINAVKRYKLVVHSESVNLQKELLNYKWKVKNDGSALPEPVKGYDHILDAVRMVVFADMRPSATISGKHYVEMKMKTGAEKYDAF